MAETDTDKDGTPDCNDLCPNDPDKTEPGDCGCGVAETDTDNDGTPDCLDLCPDNPDKTLPGICGCDQTDADTDNDGTPDCNDLCPNDPDKITPGDCGCGVAETDTDNDGTPDCLDLCPNDPDKTEPGDCGCGVAETDTDNDGTPDCLDLCPNDPDKTEPGDCGCGVADTDTDNDGTPDCLDSCPGDPTENCACPDLTSNGCEPEVSAIFNGCFSVTACSAKDLSNVVLDISPQGPSDNDIKFEGLSGYSLNFSAAQPILGVWIKSGCNTSGDCPGCGEYIANAVDLDCDSDIHSPETSKAEVSQPNDQRETKQTIQLYPNPAKDLLMIDLKNLVGKKLEISIISQNGNETFKKTIRKLEQETLELDVSQLSSSNYFLQIHVVDERRLIHELFTIQRF